MSWVIIALGLLVTLSTFFTTGLVEGQSMSPTYQDNDFVMIANYKKIKRFDIVAFVPPGQTKDRYVKRVIGLPGDRVDYLNGELFINDIPVEDEFSKDTADFLFEEHFDQKVIPKNSYFVLGDNRTNSKDSRTFGWVDQQEITGVVFE